MIFPAWRQDLSRSLHLSRSKAESKYFQVASLSVNEELQNRTMVFRGFEDESNNFFSITDVRSDKLCDFLFKGSSQICWYFVKSREQYRISARLELILSKQQSLTIGKDKHQTMKLTKGQENTAELSASETNSPHHRSSNASANLVIDPHLRKKVWGNLSSKAKQQFTWPKPKQDLSCNVASATDESASNEEEAFENNFMLMKFQPYFVDYLDLKPDTQVRKLYQLENTQNVWSQRNVNP